MVISFSLLSCALAGVKYYGLSGVDFNTGKLMGHKAKDDLPFSVCAPVGNNPYPCVVMMVKDFYDMKREYEDIRQKLIDCQKK